MKKDDASALEQVAFEIVCISSPVLAFGLVLIIGPGYTNPLRFGPYFIAIGTIGFFVPALLAIVGGRWLRSELRSAAWWLTVTGVALQAIAGSSLFVGQFFLTPISASPLMMAAAWAIASGVQLWRLVMFRTALGTNTGHGFTVEIPTAVAVDQIDNVREK